MRVLLVEDDKAIGGAVRDHAAADSHAVDWALTLEDARAFADVSDYDLILLDLQLPDGSGLSFLRSLRTHANTSPVIILTAFDQISDRIDGLNAGADDYLVKPFDLGELSARIHAVARRYGRNSDPVQTFGSLKINLAEHKVEKDGVVVDITAREWAIVAKLLERGSLVSKAQLEHAIYEFGAEVESNAIEVYVSRLRKKLGADCIITVRGLGYRFVAQ